MSKRKLLEPMRILGMIPARYQSSRFPGKILAPIDGKTLIQRTYENAQRFSSIQHLVIATDDQRIYDHVQGFGADVIMTCPSCPTGTDRLVEVLKKNRAYDDATIIVNIQGDEPCLDPAVIEKLVQLLQEDPTAVMSTAVIKLDNPEEAFSRSVVKCVFDSNYNALYFSRSLIPAGHANTMNPATTYYRHMGIYAFRREFLLQYSELPPSPLQQAEDLEQLKILEHGFRIKIGVVDHFSIGVDLPEDIKKVEKWLQTCKQNTSSSQAESVHP